MPNEQPLSIPIKPPSFDWDNGNVHDQWKLFSEQCKFLLINDCPFSKHSEPAHIAAVLNWLGPKSYQVFNNLNFDAEGKDKSKIDDVLFMFEMHFKPTLSVLQLWYQLGSIYSRQCKDQTEFMSKLCDIANDCGFANKDEIVTFSFLMHNTNESIKDQLTEKMKNMDTLNDILQLAKTVESTVQMETLPKHLLQNVGKFNATTEVHAVQKCHHSKNKHFQILDVPMARNHPAGIKVERSVVIVVIPTFQSNVLPMVKNVSNARRIMSQSFVGVQRKSQIVGFATLNVFSRKDVHEVENSKFEYDTDIVEFKGIQFSTPAFNSRKDSLNSQNIMLNEISESKKLNHVDVGFSFCLFKCIK